MTPQWQNTPPATCEALDVQTIYVNENFYSAETRQERCKELELDGYVISASSLLGIPWQKKDKWIYSLSACKKIYREEQGKHESMF